MVPSFPTLLNWRVAIEFTTDLNSLVRCVVSVRDPLGGTSPAVHLKCLVNPGSGRLDLPPMSVKATTGGIYTVRVLITGAGPALARAVTILVRPSS